MTNFPPIGRRDLLIAATSAAAVQMVSTVHAYGQAAGILNAKTASPFHSLRQIDAGLLNVAYAEMGPAKGIPVLLLHGFPYDIHSYVDVAPRLAKQGYRVIVPYLRGHGGTSFLSADTPRSGQQAAIGHDVIDLMDALKIDRAILAGYDWGGRAACVAAALWPERVIGLVSVNSYLIQDIAVSSKPASPKVERGFWYQFYFLTERGRLGLTANRVDIGRIMWRDNSPTWKFHEPVYLRSAMAFGNPDYVDIVIHSYRHRLGGSPGYPEYEELEQRLAKLPPIQVASITLDGDSDGVVTATDGKASSAHFLARRVHKVIKGVGHNLPQEAPNEFVQAVIEVGNMGRDR